MANPFRGDVNLAVGEATYTLRMSVNALVELETHFGVGVSQLAQKLSRADDVQLGDWRAVMWAALKSHHPEVTIDEAGDIMSEAGLDATINVLGQAMQAAFPQQKAGGGNRPPRVAKQAGTGKGS